MLKYNEKWKYVEKAVLAAQSAGMLYADLTRWSSFPNGNSSTDGSVLGLYPTEDAVNNLMGWYDVFGGVDRLREEIAQFDPEDLPLQEAQWEKEHPSLVPLPGYKEFENLFAAVKTVRGRFPDLSLRQIRECLLRHSVKGNCFGLCAYHVYVQTELFE